MENTYLWLKVVHILGVVLFLGNIIVTGWWKNMADLTKNPQIIAYAQRQVTLTDFIFTGGGVLILLVAGMVNVHFHDMSYATKWLGHGMAIFLVSGVIWAAVLIPIQIKQAKMAKAFAVSGEIPASYWKLCTTWNLFGLLATLIPLANLYFMVFKPA
ncbi:MAG: DUF2269 domain-containing protein [Methylotenera sp.]|nr:DUF2269 domain-containing protein [Methylotenera sp.]